MGRSIRCRYAIDLTYLNMKDGVSTKILTESIKSVIIDHDIDNKTMPMIFAILYMDKSLIDHMIKNCNDNLFIMGVSKYDDLSGSGERIECFRKRFTYFITNDLNKNDELDYNETNKGETKENTYRTLTIGMLSIDHINANKKAIELNLKNATMGEIVKSITSGINPLILEPITATDKFEQFIMPMHDSINKALKTLNDYRVLYKTPYRYYQDWKCSYLISSSGIAIPAPGDKYTSVLVSIKPILDVNTNDIGYIDTGGAYEIPVNYTDVQIFDNTIANKSRSSVQGISTEGTSKVDLKNQNSYASEKVTHTRLNNDNKDMLSNIEADTNNSNFFVYIGKNDIDTSIFTINKKISVRHIDRYREFDGDYLMYRKREIYKRENDTFIMTSAVNLKKIG